MTTSTQTQAGIEVLEERMEKRKRNVRGKGKEGANDSVSTRLSPPVIQEDTEMKDALVTSDSYEDLSHYEDEGKAPATTPQLQKYRLLNVKQ